MTVRTLATNPRDVRTPSPLARAPRAVSGSNARARKPSAGWGSAHPPPDRPADPSPSPPPQIELKTGETYRGTLLESEDNWNCQLQGITHTGRDGRVNQLEHATSAGARSASGHPGHAQNAPMFKRIDPRTGARGGGAVAAGGGGRGRGAVMRPIASVFVAALGRRVDR